MSQQVIEKWCSTHLLYCKDGAETITEASPACAYPKFDLPWQTTQWGCNSLQIITGVITTWVKLSDKCHQLPNNIASLKCDIKCHVHGLCIIGGSLYLHAGVYIKAFVKFVNHLLSWTWRVKLCLCPAKAGHIECSHKMTHHEMDGMFDAPFVNCVRIYSNNRIKKTNRPRTSLATNHFFWGSKVVHTWQTATSLTGTLLPMSQPNWKDRDRYQILFIMSRDY